MVLSKNMKLRTLREMMTAEVMLESLSMLELMVRNRRLRGDSDHLTLEELGFKNNIQVVISKVLGVPAEDHEGMDEKNKQFVGNLLFGQGGANPQAGGPGSVVETFNVNEGYQILGGFHCK
jgi:hypothetical protein